MAVVNTKSNGVYNADNSIMSNRYLYGAPLKTAVATVEVAAADDDTSVYRMFQVPSNAIIFKIDVKNDAITAGTSYDFGVYNIPPRNGSTAVGAVVDADAFASAVDMSSARVAPLDIVNEALNIDKAEKRLWEILGLSRDPGIEYDLAFTANTAGTAAGTISAWLYWSV